MKIDLDKRKQIRIYQLLLGSILLLFLYVFLSRVLPEYSYFFELISGYSDSSDLLEEESNWKEDTIWYQEGWICYQGWQNHWRH